MFPHHPSLQHPCSASSQWLDCALVSGTPGRLRSMLLRSPLLLLLPCSIPPSPPTFLRLCTYTLLPTITPIASPSFRTLYLCSMQYCIAVVASDLGSSHSTCTCNLHLHRSSRLPRSGGLHVNETRLLEALPPGRARSNLLRDPFLSFPSFFFPPSSKPGNSYCLYCDPHSIFCALFPLRILVVAVLPSRAIPASSIQVNSTPSSQPPSTLLPLHFPHSN